MSKDKKPNEPDTTGHDWDGIQELNNPLPRWWLWCFYLCIIWGIGYSIAYPAWPMINKATAGMIGYSTRANVAADIAAVDAANGPINARLDNVELSEVKDDPDLMQYATSAGGAVYRTWCAQCHGSGAAGAVSNADFWHTPVADIPVDTRLARQMADCELLELDDDAHRDEHSLEVLLPFLWKRNPSLKIVPIAINFRSIEELEVVANHLAKTVSAQKTAPLIVVSTDMSHQIPAEEAHRLDHMAIDRILELDGPGLLSVNGSTERYKLLLNSNETVSGFFIDGKDQGEGVFSSETHPKIAGKNNRRNVL